ncbi:MAG: methylated-DNA--[protein]-cysteine S-methyltransferase [Bacteroidetes bacterium]|nr:MAG: methylated-DNA--[protein]-cysteine S-methyltransferase [Bacteroidota bacterium]
MAKTYMDSPLGPLELTATEAGIRSVRFIDYPTYEIRPDHPHLLSCIEELEAYFAGKRTHFTVFLDLAGTPFQQRVWRALREIPLGTTHSYLEVAKAIQAPEAVRAVGSACARNQHWLLVPCHRVIGSDGKLTGYAAGLQRKRWLLHHEQGMLYGQQTRLFE